MTQVIMVVGNDNDTTYGFNSVLTGTPPFFGSLIPGNPFGKEQCLSIKASTVDDTITISPLVQDVTSFDLTTEAGITAGFTIVGEAYSATSDLMVASIKAHNDGVFNLVLSNVAALMVEETPQSDDIEEKPQSDDIERAIKDGATNKELKAEFGISAKDANDIRKELKE